jgi:polyphosphate kinase 1
MTNNLSDLFDVERDRIRSKFNNPGFYMNRELSWMEFNKRVLHQTMRTEVPLLERLKFLGITESNLDEFIMVRFSSILNKLRLGYTETDIAGLLPEQEYELLLREIISFKEIQQESFEKLRKKLRKNNFTICKFKHLSEKEVDYVRKLFERNIYPLLTPITFDSTKEFPLIKSKQLCIIASLGDKKNPNLNVMSIIPLHGLDRLYKIETDESDEERYILLEDIIFNFLHKVFINKSIIYRGCMRIIREADIEIEGRRDIYIVDRMRETLIKREFSKPIFMDIDSDVPKETLKLLTKIFDIDKRQVFKCENIVDMSFLLSKPIRNAAYEYDPFNPQYPEDLIGEHDMFTAIDNGDLILHHPYESFTPVIKFLEHAAEDNDVLAIKLTLYRVSSAESPIVEALCRAAERGKQVSVLLEIKARFDENRNMSLIEKLKVSGCKLIYGIEELKTHCKFILVVRKGKKNLKTYCHIGTGNYNDKTASIYTDISYFTSSSKIADDLLTIFNVLSGFSDPRDEVSKIFYAPYNLRLRLYQLIDREIENAQKGRQAFITLKLNSLSDLGIIKKLYEASEQGVKISIICRGICSMKKINSNINIKSVVGRFLEHSRIYFFYNNGKSDIFISSADMLTRNLDRRVELLVPITDENSRNKLLSILKMYFRDTFNTYILNKDNQYELLKSPVPFNVQEYFMEQAVKSFKLRSMPIMSLKSKRK